MFKLNRTKNHIVFLFFILVTISITTPFFKQGFFTLHDGEQHLARIAAFVNAFRNHNLIPRFVPYFNKGFGHPVLIFQYPLGNYLGAILFMIGFSIFDAIKIIYFCSLFLSAYFMYLYVKKISSLEAAVTAGLLYLLAPYRLVNIYVRGALGEIIAFVFMPLIFLYIEELADTKRLESVFKLAIAVALIILAHNVTSLLFLPFAFLYCLIKVKNKILFCFLPFFIGLLLSCFSWFPAFFEARYTFRDKIMGNMFSDHFLTLKQLITSPWGYGNSVAGPNDGMSFEVGKIHLILVLLTLIFAIFTNRQYLKKKIPFFMGLLISIFMTLSISEFFWLHVPLIKYAPFPWRFLSLIVFFSSIIGSSAINYFKYKKVAFLIITILLLFMTFPIAKPGKVIGKNTDYFHYTGTTTTYKENETVWSSGPMDYFFKNKIDIISGEAKIYNFNQKYLSHSFELIVKNRTLILDNTLYFPGWRVFINNKKIIPEFQNQNYRGLITFTVEPGKYNILVTFGKTIDRFLSELISAGSFIIMLCLLFWKRSAHVNI